MADAAKASQGVLRGGEDDSDDFTQVMVSSGELLAVSAHEELSHCTVLEGGEMRIEGGATVSSLLVQAGAALWVASGCSVSDMHLEAGAVVNGFTLRRNANPSDFGNGANGLALGNVNVESGATAFLEGGQSVDTCHVLSGGVLELRDGASVGISLIVS